MAGLALPGAAAGATAPAGCDASRPAIVYLPGASSPRPLGRTRPVPCRYDTGGRAMEPTLDFTRDGRVLFQEWQLTPGQPDGAPVTPNVFRSDQALTKWVDVSPTLGAVHSLDPQLIVDRVTGRIFSVNWLGDGTPTCATVSTSDDNGDSWTSHPTACSGFDGESLGVGPPATSKPAGYPNVVYYCTGTTLGSGQPTTSPICSKSLDGGVTFVPTGALPWPAADQDAQEDKFGPWAGNPIVGPDGVVYLPKRFKGQPEVAISHDEGGSWERVKVASNGSAGAAPRMAIDDKGHLFYAWTGADHHPYVASSVDGAKTWSAPLDLAPPGLKDSAIPRPAATGDGRLFVAYLGSTDAPGKEPWSEYCNILLSECDDGAYGKVTWSGYMTAVDGALSGRPVLRTATVNPPGSPLLIGSCSADGGCKAELDFIDAKYAPTGSHDAFAAFVDDCRLKRDYVPIFGAQMGPCGDNLGEGIVGRLTTVRVPAAARCASRRAFRVHVPTRLRSRVRTYDLIVAGRIVARRIPPSRGALVDLRGRRRGEVLVVLRLHLRDGRTIDDARRYHPCVHG